jgi:hypothetical protein
MSFISVQKFNDNCEIQIFKKHTYNLESINTSSPDNPLSGKARVDNVYNTLTPSDVRAPFKTLKEAEAAVLEPFEYFWPVSKPPLKFIDEECHVAHRISRAINSISWTSGRGYGNTIVVHPDDEQVIRDAFLKYEVDTNLSKSDNPDLDLTIGKPYFLTPDDIQVITHTDVTIGMPLVLYTGTYDYDHALIYVDGHGLFLNETVAPLTSYGAFVDIT